MKTIFVDSSRKSLSVALASQNKLLFTSNINSYSKHSNYLLNEINNILNQTGISINEIDNYVVLNGPGSFTGVRVGVTVCKTLAWTLSKKIYVLNNLEALKNEVENDIVICVIYDKPENSYVGIYDGKSLEDYININDDRLSFNNKNITIVSMDDNPFINNLNQKLISNNNIDIKIVKEYNYLKLINYALSKNNINPHNANPIYLKKIDAEKK